MVSDGQRIDEFYFPQKYLLSSKRGDAPGNHAPGARSWHRIRVGRRGATSARASDHGHSVSYWRSSEAQHGCMGNARTLGRSQSSRSFRHCRKRAAPPPIDPGIFPQLSLPAGLPPLQRGTRTPMVCRCAARSPATRSGARPTGTYVVTCDISVSAGVTLTIEPGVSVRFQNIGDDLFIAGVLRAVGTAAASIRFGPVAGTTPGQLGTGGLPDGQHRRAGSRHSGIWRISLRDGLRGQRPSPDP